MQPTNDRQILQFPNQLFFDTQGVKFDTRSEIFLYKFLRGVYERRERSREGGRVTKRDEDFDRHFVKSRAATRIEGRNSYQTIAEMS